MKKNIFYISSVILLLFTISCRKQIGKWDDNIKLSQKTAILNSSKNSIIITTKSTGWWLNSIAYNNTIVDVRNIKETAMNFVVNHADFQVERKDGNKIIITMNENTTNVDRLLSVGLQNGNYFDGLTITQSK
ncbi:hypothetical protein [Pedobacter alluvionis]|uniref:Uncharacterized protein n=1 Tax=Pedobacter alluvionis TaxID=475253 RepID=A0A497XZA6_9SPHI|nr:hypothetical protein [Pedobacter alluvionis]RLJ74676.1 hypothetical protein BCL90_3012 [Pedobacter alluvionis]TFB29819.1 hypothetical protein E3V97_16670 [Pedobacter alluvionis]